MAYTSLIKRRDSGIDGGHVVRKVISASYTIPGSIASYTFGGIVPAGATLVGVSGLVETAITGATSSTVGDGTTADLYAAALGIAKGSTFDSSNYKTNITMPAFKTAAGDVKFTAVGGNYTAGKIKVHVFYDEILEKMSF